ncbi:cysteine hydrolase family protein [Pleurocapsa sp. FMAR1]|uniref:cysteine hydrolase family protein n=1 Tax=Pleurocapsa sp. FMAR1 TaxID=3040204 RepID=UPI0029C64A71|nr:isochorismatase family cysteine hydrolase [Pleurocapsa sp. FMAR1]
MVLIPALPYEYEIPSLDRVALVIIDMQRDFLESGGFGEALGNDISQLQKIVPTVKQILDTFRDRALPIFHTLEGHQSDLSDCPPSKLQRGQNQLKIGDMGTMGRILILGEPGNNIIPELQPLANEIVIAKPGKGAFYRTSLESWLQEKNITHLILTGVTTEVCVQTTMREANDRGYECLLVEDATASYFPEFKQSTLEMIRAQGGIVGWTTTSENFIQALSFSGGYVKNNKLDMSFYE